MKANLFLALEIRMALDDTPRVFCSTSRRPDTVPESEGQVPTAMRSRANLGMNCNTSMLQDLDTETHHFMSADQLRSSAATN